MGAVYSNILLSTSMRALLFTGLFAIAMTVGCGGSNDQATTEAMSESTADLSALDRGKLYLEENGKRPEVTTTASGLQYEVLREGEGVKPTIMQNVTVHYEGTFIDGTVFDSSYARDEQITFGLSQVIPGWTQGLQLMPVGSKYRFVIPSDLAYGSRGAGSVIGPDETLIFTVELFDVN